MIELIIDYFLDHVLSRIRIAHHLFLRFIMIKPGFIMLYYNKAYCHKVTLLSRL